MGLLFPSVMFLFLGILLALWLDNFWSHPWFVHVGSGFFFLAGVFALLISLWSIFSTLTTVMFFSVLSWVLLFFHTEHGWKALRSKVAFWALHFRLSHSWGCALRRLGDSPIIIERALLNQLQTYIWLSGASFCVHLTFYFI